MLERLVFNEVSGVWQAELKGDLDIFRAEKLLERIKGALKQHLAMIRFDCKALTYIDSMGLGALVKINTMAKDHGGIELYDVSPKIYRLFALTKLDTLIKIEVVE